VAIILLAPSNYVGGWGVSC